MEVFAHYGPAPLDTERAGGGLDVRYPFWLSIALTPEDAQLAFNKEHPAYSEERFLGIMGSLWTSVTEFGHGNLLVKIRPGRRGGGAPTVGAAADLAGLDNCLVIFAVARAPAPAPGESVVDYCIDYREYASEAEIAAAMAGDSLRPKVFVRAPGGPGPDGPASR